VLDPFAGIGTTLKVANALGRHWLGYELKSEYIAAARERVNEPLHLRKQLIANFDKIEYGDHVAAKNKTRTPFRRVKKENENE
jgi:DNA modification methylase